MVVSGANPFGRNVYCRIFFLTLFAIALALKSGPALAAPGGGKGNQPPVIEEGQVFNLAENVPNPVVVGTVIATSVQNKPKLEYQIVGGDPGGLFALGLTTGELTTTGPLDHETTDTHLLEILVVDKFGRSDSGIVTVNVDDVNEAPAATDATFVVITQSVIGTVVGTVPASDPDGSAPFNSLFYEFIGGNTGAEFAIDANTGQITTQIIVDRDLVPSYNLTVRVTDLIGAPGGLSDTANITVNVSSSAVPSNVSEIDGTNGFALIGEGAGSPVVILGDVNGDGIDDFAVSAPGNAVGGVEGVGSVFVVFGTSLAASAEFDLTSLDGTNGFRFDGVDLNEFAGEALNSAGDINNDGFTDVLIGAPNPLNNVNGSQGRAYIVFGGQQIPPVLSAADLNGLNGFKVIGEPDFTRLGSAVSSSGDINGDGIDDIGLSSPLADFNGVSQSGRVNVIFGRQSLNANDPVFEPVIDLANFDAMTGMILYGASVDFVGEIMSPTGDLNGDGFGDFTFTALNHSRVYVVFGNLDSLPTIPGEPARAFDLTTLDGTNGFVIDGPLGEQIAGGNGGGDINGDGHSDAVIAAPGEDRLNGETQVGAAYVIFGTGPEHIWPASFDLASLDGTNGFRILGAADSDGFGFPADNRSDIDGDGFADIIAGARVTIIPPIPGPGGTPPPPPALYYLIAGSNLPFTAVIDLKNLDPLVGNTIEAAPFTSSMGAGGDVNGDGLDDFILGATADQPAHVVFGADF